MGIFGIGRKKTARKDAGLGGADRFGRIVEQYNRDNNIRPGEGTGYASAAAGASTGAGLAEMLSSHVHPGADDPEAALSSLIGLPGVKKQLEAMRLKAEFYREEGAAPEEMGGGHMCFYGNPGTGKTTVARIVAGELFRQGRIRRNSILEVDGEFITGTAPGQAARTAERCCARAMGGLLFIDEAYTLTLGQAGYEAIAVLIKAMEDARRDLTVIFAGYAEEMRQMVALNPGMRSRIQGHMFFENYTPTEMCMILDGMAKGLSRPFHIDRGAMNVMAAQFAVEAERDDFANGRDARNFLDRLISIHITRYAGAGGEGGPVPRGTITQEDAEALVAERAAELKNMFG